MGAAEKQAIEQAIADLKGVKDGDDADAITAKTEALRQASFKLGEAMYKASQASAGGAGPGPSADGGGAGANADGDGQGKEGVVDADFEEVDEKRKSGS